jgi:hypothetical protein
LFRALAGVARVVTDDNWENARIEGDVEITLAILTDKSVGFCGQSFVYHIRDAIAGWNAVHLIDRNKRISRVAFDADPVKATRKLIESHLKLKTNANGKGSFIIHAEQPVIDNFNMRRKSGLFGDLGKLARVQAKQAINDGALNDAVQKELGLDLDVVNFVHAQLKSVQPRRQAEVITNYIRLARKPRIDGDNFSPVYYANTYLREYVEANARVIVKDHC